MYVNDDEAKADRWGRVDIEYDSAYLRTLEVINNNR